MSRYPSEDVSRFDQQFAETEDERNERLSAKRKLRAALIAQLCELTKRWTPYEDVPMSQQHECRDIGRKLHAIGAEALMRDAYYQATAENRAATVIAAYWDGIGDWRW